MGPSTEIAEVLLRIHAAVPEGDEATLADALPGSDGLVLIGTDPDEWFEDRASIRDAGRGLSPGHPPGTFVLPDGSEAPFRMTMVLHREDGAWTVAQEHASFAVGNEEAPGVEL